MYEDFWTQTPLGILEFSDQRMHDVPQSEQYYAFFKAKHVTSYLEDYVRNNVYADRPLIDRIQFNSRFERLEKLEGGWKIYIEGTVLKLTAPKVIDATGITSAPKLPEIAGISEFQGRLLHHKDFGRSDILTNATVCDIIVIGGAKSAADVAYASAKAGKSVSWVIRQSGSGPAAFVAAKGQGPYRNSNENFYTRFTSYFLASVFVRENWLTKFLYRTRLGNRLFAGIWKSINAKTVRFANYDREDGRQNGFHNLKPDTDLFWSNESPSINQRDDFFDVIARNVNVLRQDIVRLTGDSMILANDTRLHADAVVFATGWKVTPSHIDDALAFSLGLPVQQAAKNNEPRLTDEVELEAANAVHARFPLLKHAPPHRQQHTSMTPSRLYKAMLPVSDHSIVFLGRMMLGNHFRNAEVQALYAVAALDSRLQLPTKNDMRKDTAMVLAWNKQRYLQKGQLGMWFYFDMVPYTDMLLDQLGLKSHRRNYWKDLFETCWARDLRGLVAEYKVKFSTVEGESLVSKAKL